MLNSMLAQTSGQSVSIMNLLVALVAFLLISGLLLAALSIYRRRMHDAAGAPRDFALSDLRTLHREGKLTDEEFDRAKSKLVASMHTKLAGEKKPSLSDKRFEEEVK